MQAHNRHSAKRRAAVACRHCSQRKVRCNVATLGIPCTNCTHDEVSCEVYPRKKRGVTQNREIGGETVNLGHHERNSVSQYLRGSVSNLPRVLPRPALPPDHDCDAALSNSPNPPDEGENRCAYAGALDMNTGLVEKENASLLYLGDKQGLGGFIFETCNDIDISPGTHVLLRNPPRRNRVSILPTGSQGLPSKEVCLLLIQNYFRHVHVFMPILDATEFLETYSAGECDGMNLLLLWSMFFACSNFVSSAVLDKAGFQTRKSMKRFMYQRAKHLYDSEYETDKISLIQAVLLMSFWYNDPEERSGAWHWAGVGISLCQSLGLHRHPKIVNSRHALSRRREVLFRRIWWSCVIRDRWMALAKGRPLRINLMDCDVPLPCHADITTELDAIPLERRAEYIPYEPETLALFWIKFVSISISLGTVLEAHYRVGLPRAGVADLESCRQQIEEKSFGIDDSGQADPIINLFGYQLQLFHEATVVVLYRPYIFKGPADPLPGVQDSWQRRASDRARSAASSTNRILEKVLEKDLVKWMTPMTITSMIPAMQIHLIDCKSSNPFTRKFAASKLELCMLVLSELRHTYWGADFTFKLFEKAQAKLRTSDISGSELSVPQGDGRLLIAPSRRFATMPSPESTAFSHPNPLCPSSPYDAMSNIPMDDRSTLDMSMGGAGELRPATEYNELSNWLWNEDLLEVFEGIV